MWGNRLGWTISAIIIVIFTASLLALQHAGTIASPMTAAFAADPANLQQMTVPFDPESIVHTDDNCDAADLYRQAIAEYDKAPDSYRELNQDHLGQLTACTPIIKAMHCKNLTLFASHPDEVINFEREKPPIAALMQVGEALGIRAQYEITAGDSTTSTREAQAVFALGAKLFNERVVYEEFEAGLALMGDADTVLLKIAEKQSNPALAAHISEFEQARKQFLAKGGRIDQLRTITKNVDGDLSAQHAGDVFALAEKSHERMWRVEACFQLGRMRFNLGDNGRAADQRHAMMLLRKLADSDPDPIVKLAAAKARDLTPQDYQRE
jgi:hypothetical protein